MVPYDLNSLILFAPLLTLCLLVPSADNPWKQFGPRSGLTKSMFWKADFEKKKIGKQQNMRKLPSMQRVNEFIETQQKLFHFDIDIKEDYFFMLMAYYLPAPNLVYFTV